MAASTFKRTYFGTEDGTLIKGKRLTRLLNRGVEFWNSFRKKHKNEIPSLSHLLFPHKASLDRYNLSRAFIIGSRFSNMSFKGADLRNIDAKSSDFEWCDFSDADLRNANFFASNFSFCKFVNSNLEKAYLVRSMLRHCDFKGAKLGDAEFGETDFINATFTSTKGLSRARHEYPSVLDTATLRQKLPTSFLRGVGLPNKAIRINDVLGGKGTKYHSCFISFSIRDKKFADRIHADLQDRDVRCWFAPHDLAIGASTLDEIDLQISKLDKLIIILSSNSLNSEWVEDEVLKAYAEERRRRSRVLVPVRIDNAVMNTREAWANKLRDQRNIGDFVQWKTRQRYNRALDNLLAALRKQRSN